MERSEDRLSTRDLASGAKEGETERDTALADAPPADSAPVPSDRADRDRTEEPVGEGDVVTDEPPAGRGPSRESIADPGAGRAGDAGAVAAGATPTTDATSMGDPTPAGGATPAPAAATAAQTGTADQDRTEPDEAAPLLAGSEELQARWEQIQVRFVDEPRGAVEDADALVAAVMKRLAEGFAQERERLEAQWGRGEDISTEDLRVALQRYRSFFQRLLST